MTNYVSRLLTNVKGFLRKKNNFFLFFIFLPLTSHAADRGYELIGQNVYGCEVKRITMKLGSFWEVRDSFCDSFRQSNTLYVYTKPLTNRDLIFNLLKCSKIKQYSEGKEQLEREDPKLSVFKAFFSSSLERDSRHFSIELSCPTIVPPPSHDHQPRNVFANILSSHFGFVVETVSFGNNLLFPDCKVLMTATMDTVKELLY